MWIKVCDSEHTLYSTLNPVSCPQRDAVGTAACEVPRLLLGLAWVEGEESFTGSGKAKG